MTNPNQYPTQNQGGSNYNQPQQQQPPQPYGFQQQGQPHVAVNVVTTQQDMLPCGIGVGWLLFILGFFFTIPWYAGLFMLFCCLSDPREKPGCIACAIASLVATILIILIAFTA